MDAVCQVAVDVEQAEVVDVSIGPVFAHVINGLYRGDGVQEGVAFQVGGQKNGRFRRFGDDATRVVYGWARTAGFVVKERGFRQHSLAFW